MSDIEHRIAVLEELVASLVAEKEEKKYVKKSSLEKSRQRKDHHHIGNIKWHDETVQK